MGKITKPGPGLPLLFINKDATNLTRTPAEAFAIGSHTSKAYRKWAKSERLSRIRLTDSVAQSTKAYLKISPRAQRSLIEECEQIEEAEDPQAFAALLKAITYQDVSVHTKSSIPTTLKDFHVPGHSPSLYRATEYCMYALRWIDFCELPRLIKDQSSEYLCQTTLQCTVFLKLAMSTAW